MVAECQTNDYVLEGQNILIREIRMGDMDGFHKMVTKSDFYYYCFDGSREAVESFVGEAVAAQKVEKGALRKSFMMAVVDKGDQNLVGHVTLDILDKAPDYFDLAYFTDPDCQGRGVATEASGLLLRHVFNQNNLDKVVATVHPNNFPSQKVLRKLGFVETGDVTSVASTNGDNIRLCYELTRKNFSIAERGMPWGPQLLVA